MHYLSYMVGTAAPTGADPIDGSVVPILNLLNDLISPMLAIVSVLGVIYCIILGVKLAKAEEPQEREKAKNALKNAIVGFLLIFILIFALNTIMPRMIDWLNATSQTHYKVNYSK